MTFLFDIGNVLLHVDFAPSFARLFPQPPPDLARRVAKVVVFKDEFESSRIGIDEFTDRTIDILGYTGPREEFLPAWRDIFSPNQPMWQCVEQLAADGHRLILFSNTNAIHMDYALPKYDIFRHFPEAVFSHLVGEVKPDEPIYHHAIDTHGLDPAATLYIDDLPANIATGRRLGLQCWQYDHAKHDAFLEWLDRKLG